MTVVRTAGNPATLVENGVTYNVFWDNDQSQDVMFIGGLLSPEGAVDAWPISTPLLSELTAFRVELRILVGANAPGGGVDYSATPVQGQLSDGSTTENGVVQPTLVGSFPTMQLVFSGPLGRVALDPSVARLRIQMPVGFARPPTLGIYRQILLPGFVPVDPDPEPEPEPLINPVLRLGGRRSSASFRGI